MLNNLIPSWLDHVQNTEEPTSPFQDFINAECPAQFLANSGTGKSSLNALKRIQNRANYTFIDWIAATARKAIGSAFKLQHRDLVPGIHTGFIGTLRGYNVAALLVDQASAVQGAGGILRGLGCFERWELATIAALTGNSKFILLVIDSANQKAAEYLVSVDGATWAAEQLVEPTALAGTCSDCEYSDVCHEALRIPADKKTDWLVAVPPPPKVKVITGAVGFDAARLPSVIRPIGTYLEESRYKRKPGYHPSTIGREVEEESPCLRVFYYDAIGADKTPFPTSLLWIFNMGHCWHEVLQDIAKAVDPSVEVEMPVKVGRLIGNSDLVYPEVIVDIKSKSRPGSRPKGYIGQVTCYGWATGLEHGAILTAYKSSGRLELDTFKLDKSMLYRLAESVAKTDEYVDAKTVPPRFTGAEQTAGRCRSCLFRTTCWTE